MQVDQDADDTWKALLGQRVRELRHAQSWTLRQLADESGLSLRFLSEVEAGRANPSLGSLRDLSRSLGVDVARLLTLSEAGGEGWGRGQGPSSLHAELHALVDTLRPQAAREALRLLRDAALELRPPVVALLGLRGAGKSSVGARLAGALQCPFVELDRLIEREAGMELGDLFELHGEARVRALEQEVLERILREPGPRVLATGGGIVTHGPTWARLYDATLTVWLKATSQTHWDRVLAQGDLRPMRHRARARSELEALYQARAPLYARAHAIVETDARDPAAVVTMLVDWLRSPRGGSAVPDARCVGDHTFAE